MPSKITELEHQIYELNKELNQLRHNNQDWTPQYRYWQPPQSMDDGGQNLLE